jgi:hypothetical protein
MRRADLLFDPEDGSSTFVQSFDELLTTRRHITKDNILQSYRCEKLKFNIVNAFFLNTRTVGLAYIQIISITSLRYGF